MHAINWGRVPSNTTSLLDVDDDEFLYIYRSNWPLDQLGQVTTPDFITWAQLR